MPQTPMPLPSAADLLTWYDRHARTLPWRTGPDQSKLNGRTPAYRVWLSEVMLQQTVVKAAIPYFLAFTARWPDVAALAAASDEDILNAWAGLGYYSRARKLIECARAVVRDHGGVFPANEAALLTLPGIGPYTAAAIAAIAFDLPATVVDGNVERVISRIFAIEEALPAAKASIRENAALLTPQHRAGDYAQAMMDLGASLCSPKRPSCVLCPWQASCAALKRGDMESFPRKAPKVERPLRRGAAFWITCADAVLLRRRPPSGLLGGMVEIPGTVWREDFSLDDAAREAPLHSNWQMLDGLVRHIFTHFALEVRVFTASLPAGTPAPEGFWWQPIDSLGQAGLPAVMKKIASVGSGG